jgi:hypothetical protein
MMKKYKLFLFTSFVCIFSSCAHLNNNKIADDTSAILAESPGAIEAVLETFKKADIVFIGGSTHQLLNDKLFLNKNLQRFYDAGVRYILAEGGIDEGSLYSDEWLLKKAYLLFFPWEYVGVRYGASDLRNEIYKINIGKNNEDKIKMVGLESGRQNFTPETYEYFKVMNYRDEYMAKIAYDFIDNARHGEKFLVIAGSSHGITETVSFNGSNSWKPLGAYLKEKYRDNFFSLCYMTLDEKIKGDNQYQKLLNSNGWRDISNNPKFVSPSNTEKLSELLPLLYESGFDSYIIDKDGIKGIMYSYALFDPDVLLEVIEQTKQYDADITILANKKHLDYGNSDIYYAVKNLLINVYYLKLYFGDNFPYNFWNPQMPLKEALTSLESSVFAVGVSPQDKMAFPPSSIDTLRDYHENIYYFQTYDEKFWDTSLYGNIKKQMSIAEPYMKKAQELFPYELWTDYWYARMYINDSNHKKAYEHLKTILDNPLVYSMQNFPEILELAAQCAEKLKLQEQANRYKSLKAALYNEYSIDVNRFSLILD